MSSTHFCEYSQMFLESIHTKMLAHILLKYVVNMSLKIRFESDFRCWQKHLSGTNKISVQYTLESNWSVDN